MNKLRDTSPSQTDRNAGFTLIEILAVLTIIMILAGGLVALAQYAGRKANESAARAEIASIDAALEQFKQTYGFYPSNDLGPLINNHILRTFSTNRIVVSGTVTQLKDPFNGYYQYTNYGVCNADANFGASNLVWTMYTQNGYSNVFSNVGPQ